MDATVQTILILAAGIVVVIGGVLWLRLHAFIALVLGALVVALLTPARSIEQSRLEADALDVISIADSGDVAVKPSKKWAIVAGSTLYAFRRTDAGMVQVGELIVDPKTDDDDSSILTARVSDSSDATIEPDDVLVTPDARKAAAALAKQTIGQRVSEGFGSTCGKIGILIAMASIIGKCLLDSGAADRIVRSTLRVLGERGAPASFVSSGFLLGIPVFFDTVFYLMIPLGKAMRMRTGRNYLLYVLTIVTGATMAHSLVPPTPGPLFVAEQLGVDIGVMILGGCVVGLVTVIYGFLHAHLVSRIWELPLRESADFSLDELEEITKRDDSDLPPFGLSLLPIVLPVILIGGNTILKRFADSLPDTVVRMSATLGDKNIALVLSAAIALFMLVRQKKAQLRDLAESIQSSLASGGVIILITAAGGAFGKVLQQTGVSGLIRDLPQSSPVAIIVLAFLITTAIRTAQGSATVAMITAVGILSGLATSGQLPFHPLWLALAIGCGSKPIGWMNDSGFWVITKMSGMTEAEGLKYVTPMTSLMGVVGLGATIVGVLVLPNF